PAGGGAGHPAFARPHRVAGARAGLDHAGARASAAGPRVRARRQRRGRRPAGPRRGVFAVKIPGLLTRVLIVAAIIAIAFGGLVARLSYLQLVRHAELTSLAARQYSRVVVLHAQRGPIVDRHGAPLATSSPAESLFAHPRGVGDPVRVAARLAPI